MHRGFSNEVTPPSCLVSEERSANIKGDFWGLFLVVGGNVDFHPGGRDAEIERR